MKLTQIVTGLLFATFVTASTDFIPDGQRAKLFELMDDEVPDFRITLPPSILQELKTEISAGGGGWFGKRDEIGKEKRQWGGQGGFGGQGQGGFGGQGQGGWGGQGQGGFGGQGQGGFGGQGQGGWGGFGGQGGFGGGWGGFGGGGGGFMTQKENWKTKNATLSVTVGGVKKDFDKVTFSIGGSSSRMYARQAFNLKIRGKDDLFGRKQFRIRSEAREATYLRSKLVCDIQNRLGMTSISANYMSLYVNNEYWGFYVFMDSPKPTWAELEYGDKDSTHVMKCKSGGATLTVRDSATQCVNENDEVTDNTEWRNFLDTLDRAQSINDVKNIFDVDQFINNMIYEYLCGSWDHFLNTGHNFVVYKKPQQFGGKWTMIEYDFDGDFGQDVCAVEFAGSIKQDKDYPSWSFADWTSKSRHILDVCIKKDQTRFKQLLEKFVAEAFNPGLLFPRIDELKDFIRPYVQKDKTPVNGRKPGMLNTKATADYTMAQWEANSEFTNIGVSSSSSAYGLKFWILLRYRKVCNDYKLQCDPEYMNINYYYDVDRAVEGPINTQFMLFGGGQPANNTPKTTQSQPPKPAGYTSTRRTTTKKTTRTTTNVRPTGGASGDCVVKSLGYPCCSPNNTEVFYTDENGDWGVENGDWCGITKAQVVCWSEALGYPCCSTCSSPVYSDNDGNWGIENGDWCGLLASC